MVIPFILRDYSDKEAQEQERSTTNIFCDPLVNKVWGNLTQRQQTGVQQLSMINTYWSTDYYYKNREYFSNVK